MSQENYASARAALERGKSKEWGALAKAQTTHPEMLYYLAQNGDAPVRASVAANSATPIQADEFLSDDEIEDVRAALALKIGRLLPDVPEAARDEIGLKSLAILEKLAADELPRIRGIVADAVKAAKHVPHGMVRALAEDVEAAVSAPILQYSPMLSDEDLREIIAAGAGGGALNAIAKRADVAAAISHDLVATLNTDAIGSLLTNKGAQIREDTLDAIIDAAPSAPPLHEPLAQRENMSLRAMKRIAGFVASTLVSMMVEKNGLDEAAAEEVLTAAREAISADKIDDAVDEGWREEADALLAASKFDDALVRALIKDNKRGVLLHCFSLALEAPYADIRRIFKDRDAKVVTALAWKAGLTMRTGLALQRSIALINASDILPAKDGVDFPMEEGDMEWLLASQLSEAA